MARTVSCRDDKGTTASGDDGLGLPDCGETWEHFRRSRSASARNSLIERYMPLVRAISGRLIVDLPSSVLFEDLVSAGTFGLMDAIERYDPKLGSRFETYCALRIRGAMLDELRTLNWVPRMQCHRAGKVRAAICALKGELGRAPTSHEIARHSGLKLRDVARAPKADHRHVSLTNTAEETDEKWIGNTLEARGLYDPVDVLQEKELRDLLAEEIRRLPQPDRLVVMLYYFEELTMRQIGEVLNVTESRVCQIHAEILARLQQRLTDLDECRPSP